VQKVMKYTVHKNVNKRINGNTSAKGQTYVHTFTHMDLKDETE